MGVQYQYIGVDNAMTPRLKK